jgi:transposase-like protein
MAKDSRKPTGTEENQPVATSLEAAFRMRARAWIDAIVEEEIEAALGAAPSARVGTKRQGYRHGTRERTLTTSLGPTTFAMPRARVRTPEGGTAEWRSELVPRYQRRSERVDEAILGVYLSGTNTRRIKARWRPCCVAGRCRRTRCRGWWAGSRKISRPGGGAISTRMTSGT